MGAPRVSRPSCIIRWEVDVKAMFGVISTVVGVVGLVSLALGVVAFGYALAQGVHCPSCDHLELVAQGPGVAEWWERHFLVKDGLMVTGFVLSLVATPLARPRRWPFGVGAAVALAIITLTPR